VAIREVRINLNTERMPLGRELNRAHWGFTYWFDARMTRIIGRDDAIAAPTGKVVRPVSVLLRARLEPLLAGLGADELARLRAEGAAMRDDQAFKLGFGDDV
jgi:hypothetical protein